MSAQLFREFERPQARRPLPARDRRGGEAVAFGGAGVHEGQPERSGRDPRHQPRHASQQAQGVSPPGPMSPNRPRSTTRREPAEPSNGAAPRRRRALLSVSDKQGLVPFAAGLADLGLEIVSTGGTA